MNSLGALEELVCYLPALVLHRVGRDTGATLTPSVERFPAAALFADLSGFTAMTEHLAHHSPSGAEDLTSIIDLYFAHLINVVHNHGGDVVKFAGDGLLALWYGDEPLADLAHRAVQCGLGIQMMMAPAAWTTLEGMPPPAPLKVRVGISSGEVSTMYLGGVFGRWELLVTGTALVEGGRVEAEAHAGEVLIAPATWPLVAEACLGLPLPSGAVRLESLLDYLPVRALVLPPVAAAMHEALRAYIPKAILARISAGQTAWLAEQRRLTVLFVNLPDLTGELALPRAQSLMRALQHALYRYEGSITRLGTDAKGPSLVAAFGLPPLAHENDAERGLRAALDIVADAAKLGLQATIGVSSGRALCGAVGGATRREYTMMGPMVNRAARLMQAAMLRGPYSLLCDETTMRSARTALSFEPLAPLRLKGFAEPVPIYVPLATQPSATLLSPWPENLLQRARERRLITRCLNRLAQHGKGGMLLIEGNVGIGKSALLQHACLTAPTAGVTALCSAGNPVDSSPYYAWRRLLRDLPALATGDETIHSAVVALQRLGLAALVPFVNDYPDCTPGPLSPHHTHLLCEQFVQLVTYTTAHMPLLLGFEDGQWFDSDSWTLLEALNQQTRRLLIIVAVRPSSDLPPAFRRLAERPGNTHLQLGGLRPAVLRPLLAAQLGVARVPRALLELIAARSQGNPFVAEELLLALRERGAVTVSNGVCHFQSGGPAYLLDVDNLPDTVEGLITSRIDRLDPAEQLTLKVASVIGPTFAFEVLAAIHPVEQNQEQLRVQLTTLQQAGLLQPEPREPAGTYAFRHAISCEVAYNLMSFGQRRHLHRLLATYYEHANTPGTPAQLAHHHRLASA